MNSVKFKTFFQNAFLSVCISNHAVLSYANNNYTLHGRTNAFFHLLNHDSFLCTTPKVACTSIRTWLISLVHAAHREKCSLSAQFNDNEVHRMIFGRQECLRNTSVYKMKRTVSKNLLESYFKATFVRHPMDRFISAMVDRNIDRVMSGIYPTGYNSSWRTLRGFGVDKYLTYLESRNESFRSCKELNGHFLPQSCFCLHRYIKYNLLGRLENFDNDWLAFLAQLNNRSRIKSRSSHSHHSVTIIPEKKLENRAKKTFGTSIRSQLIGNITVGLARRLSILYMEDFLRFNYSMEEWWQTNKPALSLGSESYF